VPGTTEGGCDDACLVRHAGQVTRDAESR